MPEGDTVWLCAARLQGALAGRPLVGSDFRVPALATTDLAGRAVLEVLPRGKHLLTRLSGQSTLHTHFRMEGSWHLYRPGDPWTGGPTWQVRAVLANEEWVAVGYRLAVVQLLATSEESLVVGHLGPDVLSEDFDASEAARRLAADKDREIGWALLDQRLIAGLGNLYRSEVLFLRGLAPSLPVGSVRDLPALVGLASRLMRANRGRAEQSTTGSLRRGTEHWVFERSGRPCRRCGSRIRSAQQAEGNYRRIAYWCPSCQPATGPAQPSSLGRGPGG